MDSHLNSAHLDLPRREDYRRARQALLEARGVNTLRLELDPPREVVPGDTIADAPARSPTPSSVAPFILAETTQVHPLKLGLNTVGRLPDNDVVIADLHVSRRHCAVLVHTNYTCEVHDTASKNGTYLNGQLVTCPTRLKPGDEIRMCDLRLTFLNAGAPAGDAAPDKKTSP
jgi:hypothetical protein